ncbi:GNAT family N-acetyltransferase [Enterovirga aerilata]|uniref:GNAT family N-acetyltransferase n=1 Tax=Enterovirga aerilata TaxID=2730920 RepID=A0A849I727_9HYPH|nr:GNAT family N-acetyltransferase [Enterovirga sp. DB1703]NNM71890.1 GNAT family N-acetyltransferase [Enterovirga sp. DB1703]
MFSPPLNLDLAGLPDRQHGSTAAKRHAGHPLETSLPHGPEGQADLRPTITVEIADAARLEALSVEWRDLVLRCAEPNVFMDPAVAVAAAAAGTPVRAVIAWRREDSAATRVVGIWLLIPTRPSSRLPIRILGCPTNSLTFLGTPVLDADDLVGTLGAMFAALAADPDGPKIICACDIAADGPVLAAMREALARQGFTWVRIESRARAKLDVPGGGVPAASKSVTPCKPAELRRLRKRLGELGDLVHVRHSEPEEVAGALDEFLLLEAAGWKGRSDAILAAGARAPFARAMIAGLARNGSAGVDALRLNGRAIAMNVWLRSGHGVFGWKMAYDEAYRRFSPGNLLLDEVARHLFADGVVRFMDSCNRNENTPLAQIWTERRMVEDMVIDLHYGGSSLGRFVAATELCYRTGKAFARRLKRAAIRRLRSRRPATTREEPARPDARQAG